MNSVPESALFPPPFAGWDFSAMSPAVVGSGRSPLIPAKEHPPADGPRASVRVLLPKTLRRLLLVFGTRVCLCLRVHTREGSAGPRGRPRLSLVHTATLFSEVVAPVSAPPGRGRGCQSWGSGHDCKCTTGSAPPFGWAHEKDTMC